MDKVAVYSDDTLLFLEDMDASFANVMSLICKFSIFSGYTINWDKSVLLPIDLLAHPFPNFIADIQLVVPF